MTYAGCAANSFAVVDESMPAVFRRSRLPAAVLIVGDLLMLELCVLGGLAVRAALTGWFPIGIGPSVFAGLHVAVLALPLAYWMVGLYPGYGRTAVERLRDRVNVTVLAFGTMMVFDHLVLDGQWSRGVLLAAAVLAVVAVPLWDSAARRLMTGRHWWGEPVAVLGPSPRREQLAAALMAHRELGWRPVALGEWPERGASPVAHVQLAVLVQPPAGVPLPPMADDMPYRRIVLVPDVGVVQSLWISARDLGAHVGLEMRRNLLVPGNQGAKRALDIGLAALGLVVVAPMILTFALLIRLTSPGPAFFSQERESEGGRRFRLWKLRTMVPDAEARLGALLATSDAAAEEWRHHRKLRRDPRVTALGRFMRRFSIDELPQLWNVLRGEMSLVGPRPLPSDHVEVLEPASRRLRNVVRPGITGLWQVSGRSARDISELEQLDSYYVRNWSLWLDIHIILRTFEEIVRGKGAW